MGMIFLVSMLMILIVTHLAWEHVFSYHCLLRNNISCPETFCQEPVLDESWVSGIWGYMLWEKGFGETFTALYRLEVFFFIYF